MQLKVTLQSVTQQSHGKEAEEKVTSMLYVFVLTSIRCTHLHACTHTHTYIRTHAHTHAHTHSLTNMHTHARNVTIHNMNVSIYYHLCIMIQRYIARYNQV